MISFLGFLVARSEHNFCAAPSPLLLVLLCLKISKIDLFFLKNAENADQLLLYSCVIVLCNVFLLRLLFMLLSEGYTSGISLWVGEGSSWGAAEMSTVRSPRGRARCLRSLCLRGLHSSVSIKPVLQEGSCGVNRAKSKASVRSFCSMLQRAQVCVQDN